MMAEYNIKQFINYKPSYYSKALKKYQRHTSRITNPFIKIIAFNSSYSSKYPLYQMLKACANLLILNQLELSLLAYFIQKTRWDIHNQIIKNNYDQAGSLICSSSISPQYKQLNLYLLLIGWAAKIAMNEDCKFLQDQIKKISFNFKSIFQNWLLPYENILTIHPCVFNRIYTTFTNLKKSQNNDYQLMVDVILQLSHQYNNKQQKKDKVNHKKDYVKTLSFSRQEKQLNSKKIINCQASFVPFELNYSRFDTVQPNVQSLFVFQQKEINNSIDGMSLFHSSHIGDLFARSNLIRNRISQHSYFEIGLTDKSEIFGFQEIHHTQLSNILGFNKGDSILEKKQEDNIFGYIP